ncbi:O-antigen ligase [Lachnospiraceae bacterium NLAE-zl-G231]|nr:O-antigen ligase [Lachnospiraceae bacterium NLAE-zl-G231]
MKNYKISLDTLILAICILGFLKPPFTIVYPKLDLFFNSFRIVSLALVIIYFFSKKIRVSYFSKLLIVFELFLIVCTYYRNGNTVQALISALTIIGEVILFEIAIKSGKKKFINFIDFLTTVLSIYVVLNILSIIFLPEGFTVTENNTPLYFLGIHNRFAFWMIPLISLSCLSSYLKKGKLKIRQYVIHMLCLLTLINRNATGAVISVLFFYVFIIFIQKNKAKWADYRIYLLIYLIIWLGFTFFGFLDAFSWLTVNFLKKSGSLEARLSLWEKGKMYLTKDISHLLFGYGLESDSILKQKFWYSHLHNNLLNIIYQTGIIGGVLYCLPFSVLIIPFKKYKYNNVCRILSFSIFIFLIMLLVDTYDLYGHFYILGVIGGNIDYLLQREEVKITTERDVRKYEYI